MCVTGHSLCEQHISWRQASVLPKLPDFPHRMLAGGCALQPSKRTVHCPRWQTKLARQHCMLPDSYPIHVCSPTGCAAQHPGSHDVGCNDRFVVLPPGDLAQIEQVPDDCHKEPILLILRHGSTDGANGPAQGIEPLPRPLRAAQLQARHGRFRSQHSLLRHRQQCNTTKQHEEAERQILTMTNLAPLSIPILLKDQQSGLSTTSLSASYIEQHAAEHKAKSHHYQP